MDHLAFVPPLPLLGGGGTREWDYQALENWYTRRFLGDHKDEVTTGLQLTIEVARSNWCTSANLSTFYTNIKAQLVEVNTRILILPPKAYMYHRSLPFSTFSLSFHLLCSTALPRRTRCTRP